MNGQQLDHGTKQYQRKGGDVFVIRPSSFVGL
jgi:hypothetical protein